MSCHVPEPETGREGECPRARQGRGRIQERGKGEGVTKSKARESTSESKVHMGRTGVVLQRKDEDDWKDTGASEGEEKD